MRISESDVLALKHQADRELARNIHSEDAKVYQRGLDDGVTVLAQWVLERLKEEVILPPHRPELNRMEEGIETVQVEMESE